MRVLLVAGSYPPEPCGVGDYTRALARALAGTKGLQVAVLAKRDAEQDQVDNYDLLNVIDGWRLPEVVKICRRVLAWSPDVIHIQYPAQGFFNRRLPQLLPLILRTLGLRVVQTWHEPPPTGGSKAMAYFLLPLLGASGLIFVRPSYLDYFPPRIRRWVNRVPSTMIQSGSAIPTCKLDPAQREALRLSILGRHSRLLVFFGFVHRNKDIGCLFDIAEPGVDRIVIAGSIGDDSYVRELIEIAESRGLAGATSFTGFIAADAAADLLAVADAVVLPFADGGGVWNTSIHSATAQGTFVITTGVEDLGFHPESNIYTVKTGDLAAMRAAFLQYAGRKLEGLPRGSAWGRIADSHASFYAHCLPDSSRSS